MQAVADKAYLDDTAVPIRQFENADGTHSRLMPSDSGALKSPAELARLIEAVAARQDRDAFVVLFDHFAPRIKGFLMRGNTPAGLAEELAQEALIMVWRKAGQFDRSRAGASAWIFTIARNLRIDIARREQRAKLLDAQADENLEQPAPPDAELLASELERRVLSALEHLSDDQMRVVRLSFFEGKAHAEIATELELPLGTVKSRIRLAMNRLRELLGDMT